jgi:hypothetical protein
MSRYYPKVKYKSFDQKVKERFELTCKKCGSKNVVIDYQEEGGYSEHTQWGSHVSIGCNDCQENDFYE